MEKFLLALGTKAPIRLGLLPLPNFALTIEGNRLDQTKRLPAEIEVELVSEVLGSALHAASSFDASNSLV